MASLEPFFIVALVSLLAGFVPGILVGAGIVRSHTAHLLNAAFLIGTEEKELACRVVLTCFELPFNTIANEERSIKQQAPPLHPGNWTRSADYRHIPHPHEDYY